MRIAVIGAGIGGMAAANDLVKAGHQVTIFESSSYVGGLAAGFKEPGWDWSVEQFYHHIFTTDKDMLAFVRELGWEDQVLFLRPKTVVYHKGDFYPLDSPLAALTFPGFNLLDMVRFGFVTAYLRYLAGWKPLEAHTADSWMRRAYGEKLYKMHFEPLLIGKFAEHYKEVNMAWFWARFKARSTQLGTFKGGFQAFSDRLRDELSRRGVKFCLSTPVQSIRSNGNGGLEIHLPGSVELFDRCLATISPGLMAKLAQELPETYLRGLLSLGSMGAVVLILSLKQKLSSKGYYWYNIPKSAGFPFLALVEHTNFLSPEYFNGDHIVYCGDYLEPSHEYFKMTREEILQRYIPGIKRINPEFNPEWIENTWLFRTTYAQPIPLVNHSAHIPSIKTPISGLYFASMSQVYPWDRGTNFAVQIGRQAASLILQSV